MPSNASHLSLSFPRPRRVEPVCSGLQAQILRCYRDHLHEVLLCSDLAKAYQHCVSTAHKVRPSALVCKHETAYAWAPAFRCPILHLAQSPFSLLLGPQTCPWEQYPLCCST